MGKNAIAIITGSGIPEGLEACFDKYERKVRTQTPFGESANIYVGEKGNLEIIVLPRHSFGNNGFRSPADLVIERGFESNIFAIGQYKPLAVYGFSAVGAIDKNIPLVSNGTFVVPNHYIRGFGFPALSLGKEAKEPFPNMGDPFDATLRKNLVSAIRQARCKALEEGTYICNIGPFESNAEIFMQETTTRGLPNRLVGMTVVPELILLKQLGIPFAAICSNVNYAQGLDTSTPVSHEQTKKEMGAIAPQVLKVIKNLIEIHS